MTDKAESIVISKETAEKIQYALLDLSSSLNRLLTGVMTIDLKISKYREKIANLYREIEVKLHEEKEPSVIEKLEELYDDIIEDRGFEDPWARRLYDIIQEFHRLYGPFENEPEEEG